MIRATTLWLSNVVNNKTFFYTSANSYFILDSRFTDYINWYTINKYN